MNLSSIIGNFHHSVVKLVILSFLSLLLPQTVVPSTTAVAVADALPNSSQASFIAPNAMIAGDVTVGSGSSAWYGAVLRGKFHHEKKRFRILNMSD